MLGCQNDMGFKIQEWSLGQQQNKSSVDRGMKNLGRFHQNFGSFDHLNR